MDGMLKDKVLGDVYHLIERLKSSSSDFAAGYLFGEITGSLDVLRDFGLINNDDYVRFSKLADSTLYSKKDV